MFIWDLLKRLFNRGASTPVNTQSNVYSQYASLFGVAPCIPSKMFEVVNAWNTAYQNTDTQLMKIICREASKLTLTDLLLTVTPAVDGTDTQLLMADMIDSLSDRLRSYLEIGIALGGLILKASPSGISLISPTNFIPIEYDSDGNITAAIFIERAYRGNNVYTKLEYHHFADDKYLIDTQALVSSSIASIGSRCDLSSVRQWSGITPHISIDNLEEPLFSYFRMPGFNNIDESSVSGISLCSSAIAYLERFDETFKASSVDMKMSRKVLFVDKQLMNSVTGGANTTGRVFSDNPLPNLITELSGTNKALSDGVREYNPTFNIEKYKVDLQMQLDLVAVACGFTSGYFTFDSRRTAVTATQIEAEDQVTVSTITAIRDKLAPAIERAVRAYYNILMLYGLGEPIDYEFKFYARDLSATPTADREHTLALVEKGYYPLWLYLSEYEGFSKEEAQKFVAERDAYIAQEPIENSAENKSQG